MAGASRNMPKTPSFGLFNVLGNLRKTQKESLLKRKKKHFSAAQANMTQWKPCVAAVKGVWMRVRVPQITYIHTERTKHIIRTDN